MTLGFRKKTRTNYHNASLKGRYLIPLQTPLSGKSNRQYVGSHTDLATAEMQIDDCPYVSVPTRADVVSRWAGKTGTKKKFDSTVQRSSDMLLDRPSYYTFSHFSESDLSVQSITLPYLHEVSDRNGGMK